MTNARALALQILLSWQRSGTYPDQLLRDLLAQNTRLKPSDRALIYQLVYGVLRWQGKLDWIIQQFSQRPLEKLSIKTRVILRLGVFQMLFLTRIPVSAAVNESVKLAKSGRTPWAANFINAVLRSLDRGKERLSFPSKEDPLAYLAVNYSHPAWLVKQWVETWGFEKTEALCQNNNRIPPLTLRVNTLRTNRRDLLPRLERQAARSGPTSFSPLGIRVEEPDRPLVQDEMFHQGFFQIQDEASQLVAYILDPQPGERILDLCAGAGGKAGHLAQLMNNQGTILAVDLHPGKIEDLQGNARRLGITIIKGLVGDAFNEALFQKKTGAFDRILIDAPCSGWGVIGRNPDLKWRLSPEDSPRLAGMQNKFLQNAAGWLKSKGVLVYVTCTLSREENQGVIETFIDQHPEFVVEDASAFLPEPAHRLVDDDGFYQTWPPVDGMDGFFAARLRKTGSGFKV
ncbi:MAG: 16S rRNA (cytosine(967)-C(5))-methyltransferase RsmB [Pseudomonadota bacterium]